MDLVERLRERLDAHTSQQRMFPYDVLPLHIGAAELTETVCALEALLRAVEPFVRVHDGIPGSFLDDNIIRPCVVYDGVIQPLTSCTVGDFRALALAVQAVKGGG